MAYFRCTGEGGAPVPVVAEPYIYNTDLVYFNTGHKHTANTKVRFKGEFNWCYNYFQVWGARSANFRNNAFGFFASFNSPRVCFYRTNVEQTGEYFSGPASDTTTMFYMKPVVVECEGNIASWYAEDDPTNIHGVTATGGTVDAGIAPLGLFCCNSANQADAWWPEDGAVMKLYWFEIYESGNLVHRFVPAYHNGQYCLFDEIDQVYIFEVYGKYSRLRGSPNIPTA